MDSAETAPPTAETAPSPERDGPGARPRLRNGALWLAAVVGLVALGWFGITSRSTQDRTPTTGADVLSTTPARDTVFPWEMSPPPPSLVPLEEIRSGGPPPDGIPPIDDPVFVSVAEAEGFLEDVEPVQVLVHEGEARAYPLQIMTWHEIVNDVIAGDPITVTFCPLCNSGLAFDRRVTTTDEARDLLGVDEAVIDLGTSGRLYKSNLVAYDRQTKSLWIQFTGQAVAGPFMGTDLRRVPVQIASWRQFAQAHPDGLVLSRDTGFSRAYGSNPYVGYDDINASPFLFDEGPDGRLPPMAKVAAVVTPDGARAYTFRGLEGRASGGASVLIDAGMVIFYEEGTASALDSSNIAQGRDVGAVGIFRPELDGRQLDFEVSDGRFVDVQSSSVWNLLGEAVSGPLEGSRLPPVVFDDTFWFVWAAFQPDTVLWDG